MEPPARESVRRMNAHLWTLGSQMICISIGVEEIPPLHSLCSWQNGDSMLHRLTRDKTLLTTSGKGDSAIDRIQECGTGGSIWAIGSEVICKVKSWREGRQLEAATITFVSAKCPSVPVPEVIYSWIDHEFQRTFLIMKRVYGRTLNQAWLDLSESQRLDIANELAQPSSVLALQTSPRYETASGHGILEYWLMGQPPSSNPTWLPMVLGPFTGTQMKVYMSRISSKPVPEFDEQLPFYHPDLGPTNILVSDDGDHITAIIDWEAAAYFPSFWVSTRPASNWAFRLSDPNTNTNKNAWSSLFVKALEGKGFKCPDKVYTEWSSAKIGPA